jgi:nucleoside-diphosphate kinase
VTERTLVLVKPDGVQRRLIGEVISRIERKGLDLVALELRTVERELAEQHYAEHDGKPFFGDLLEFITSGQVLAAVVEGPRAIAAFRQLAGGTDPVEVARKEGSDFGTSITASAPSLWIEAVLARRPAMPSDLEARLLQGSALPVDSLLREEVREALRDGFWRALELARG